MKLNIGRKHRKSVKPKASSLKADEFLPELTKKKRHKLQKSKM